MAVKPMKIKQGDLVQVLSGKDRGKQGRVLEARPKEGRVLVENLNMIKRHTRPRPMSNPSRMGAPQMQAGGVIEKAGPIPVSNVMVVCPACQRPTRVGTVIHEVKGRKQGFRVCRRADCGQQIDR
jgi:large subunit ribosomal protein L24